MTALFFPGRAEALKWSVHAGLFGLASVCAGYNLIAWTLRGDRHLARNSALYLAIVAIELTQMERHR